MKSANQTPYLFSTTENYSRTSILKKDDKRSFALSYISLAFITLAGNNVKN